MSRIVCFVVDTSVSMGQSLGGLSALDASKAACEHYLKKSAFGKTEKVMLVSCGSGMSGVLCGWKDPPSRLLEQLKSLKAEDCSDLGSSIRKAFDMLNFMRQQSGVDHLGAGRKPWSLLQAHVIVLTDGGSADLDVAAAAGSNNLLMPDWYRWDQRLFAVINSFPRLLGAPPEAVTDSPSCSKLQQLCEMTGGSAYFPTSLPSLLACMENILDRAQYAGVSVCLECQSPVPRSLPTLSVQFVRLQLATTPNQAAPRLWWPLPEDYHVTLDGLESEASSASSGAGCFTRSAQPTLLFSASDKVLTLLPSFPVDKYELEASAFASFFVKNAKEGMCWPLQSRFNMPVKTFVNGSIVTSNSCEGKLVGFIRQSSHRQGIVNLYVLPYNFPELFRLLDELQVKNKGVASPQWKAAFETYVRNLPYYYVLPLRTCLNHMGLPTVMPGKIETSLPQQLGVSHKRMMSQTKAEADRFDAQLEQYRKEEASSGKGKDDDPTNILSLPRHKLLSELNRLRVQVDAAQKKKPGRAGLSSSTKGSMSAVAVVDDERRFSLPIALMGDYHEKQQAAQLRDPRAEEGAKPQLFGNPYFPIEKVANRVKKDALVLDEAPESDGERSPSRRKRSPTRKSSPDHNKRMSSPTDLSRQQQQQQQQKTPSPPDLHKTKTPSPPDLKKQP